MHLHFAIRTLHEFIKVTLAIMYVIIIHETSFLLESYNFVLKGFSFLLVIQNDLFYCIMLKVN